MPKNLPGQISFVTQRDVWIVASIAPMRPAMKTPILS
jgi:hypothetical protein